MGEHILDNAETLDRCLILSDAGGFRFRLDRIGHTVCRLFDISRGVDFEMSRCELVLRLNDGRTTVAI